ncbi:CLC3A-like protein [Mya arenaria]|uniref:CLC3A-like protein n=1 Tax=Mya arenaria TaxID=6604 RepID=A0ABY7FA62_MYAAR|nr:CLC3A-like protein [Mya arenaria]
MKGEILIIGLFLVSLPDTSLATDCPDGWMAYNASCYLFAHDNPYHWIGLTDDVIEGQWKWHDTDQVATFTNWWTGQPDGLRNANCVIIHAALQYKWTDQGCQESFKPLCEIASVY